jgi:hypothetical protein
LNYPSRPRPRLHKPPNPAAPDPGAAAKPTTVSQPESGAHTGGDLGLLVGAKAIAKFRGCKPARVYRLWKKGLLDADKELGKLTTTKDRIRQQLAGRATEPPPSRYRPNNAAE